LGLQIGAIVPFDKEHFSGLLAGKQLIRESAWMRVYRLGESEFYHESKFVADRLEVKADEFERNWPKYTAQERRDFAEAYSAKPRLSGDDHQILRYLMEKGTEETWGWIALRLTELPEKERVLDFLLVRIETNSGNLPNYVQALEVLGDPKAAGPLTRKFEQYRTRIPTLKDTSAPDSFFDCVCYLACCKALIKLAGSQEARKALNDMERFQDERVQVMAREMSTSD
jgi:hypothetical protein